MVVRFLNKKITINRLLLLLLIVAGCRTIGMIPAGTPAVEPLVLDQVEMQDTLDVISDRLEEAVFVADSGNPDSARVLLRNLFLLADSLEIADAQQELLNLKLAIASELVSLLPELEPDSVSTAGIHGVEYTLEQFSDSLLVDSLSFDPEEHAKQSMVNDSLLEVMEALSTEIPIHPDLLPGIPEAQHRRINQMVDYFTTGKGRKYYKIWLERYPKVAPVIRNILREEGVPEDLVFLSMIESGFRIKARSHAKAVGPWQFIASSGRIFGLRTDYWVDERVNLEKSTRAAAKYLRRLYERYDDWFLAFSAYNWGASRVDRGLRKLPKGKKTYWNIKRMPRETRNYVPTFLAARIVFKNMADYELSVAEDQLNPVTLEEVKVKGALNLTRLSEMLGSSETELKDWNPQLRRFCTPPDGGYILVPTNMVNDLATKIAGLPESAFQDWIRHKVRRGDTLGGIANRYGVSLRQVLSANKLNKRSIIRPGQNILVPLPTSANNGSTVYALADVKTMKSKTSNGGLPVYRVRRGDALSLIANRFKVKVSELKKWNALSRADRIYPGQELLLADPVSAEKALSPGKSVVKVESKTSTINTSSKNKSAQAVGPMPKQQIHVVRAGETAGGIARLYGIKLAGLKSINNLDGSSRIYTGQKLNIPSSGKQTDRLIHIVNRGDTLWDLASYYKVRVSDIRRWNNLGRSSRIYPGKQLVIFMPEQG
jgi:membrane-bound lytic murein transglycosylase D